jgi:hypothetical protein
VDLAAAQERPYAEREGAPEIAGEYTGLRADRSTCPPAHHFLGNPSWDIYRYGEKIQVLVCECGEPGCGPLVCRIEVGDDRVVWSDFEQPHRSAPKSKRVWNYEGFGPFVFERAQYEAALEALKM